MKTTDIIARSGRNLRSSKLRTLLTALAIAVGGFTLTITLAAGNGLRDYTDKLVANNFDPSELIVGRDAEVSNNGAPLNEPKEYDESVGSVSLGGPNGSLQIKQVSQQDVDQLKALPYVESVRENYQLDIRYITREGQKKYTASGAAYNSAQKPEVAAGQLPQSGDLPAGTILLPDGYIAALGFKDAQDAIGQKVQITFEKAFSISDAQALLQQAQQGGAASLQSLQTSPPQAEQKTQTFTVGGVVKRPATSFAIGALPVDFSNADAKQLYDYTSQGTANYQKYMFVYARIKDGTNEAKIQEAQRDLESKGYYVQTSKDIQKAITQFVNILQIMVGVFGLITLIASVFGIINTQYISVLERTREIGLMKALGMRSKDVRRLFMVEATWIGFLGGAIGAGLGFIAGTALNPWLTKQLDLGAGNNLFIFEPFQIAVMILMLMVVATIAGWLPARKASKMDPIEALRSE